LDASIADAALLVLEGFYKDAFVACSGLECRAQILDCPHAEIWLSGVRGLVHVLNCDWEKANDFLRHSVMGVERCCPISDQFFHEYVLSLFAEPLGYLM
jgi:hypothetical protein